MGGSPIRTGGLKQRQEISGRRTQPRRLGEFLNVPVGAHAFTATRRSGSSQPDDLTGYNHHPTTTVGPFKEQTEQNLPQK